MLILQMTSYGSYHPVGISLPFLVQAGHLFDVVALSGMTQTDTLTKSSQHVIHVDIKFKKYVHPTYGNLRNVMNCY